MIDRLDPQELRNRLYNDKYWSKKDLGQHFLIDGRVLEAMLEAAELSESDTVVEVGPGMGVLTEKLLEQAGHVVAFEYDFQMVKILQDDFKNEKLELVAGDVLQTAVEKIPTIGAYKVVANIPYQITTPLIKLFLEGGVSVLPERLVLLVQKEVGERLTAGPSESGRGFLSMLTQYYSDAEYVVTVPRASFWPIPGVDSAVISLHIKQERRYTGEDESNFLRYVKRAWTQPRKQLKNVLAGMRGVAHTEIGAQFIALGLPENIRVQELNEDQWDVLYRGNV